MVLYRAAGLQSNAYAVVTPGMRAGMIPYRNSRVKGEIKQYG